MQTRLRCMIKRIAEDKLKHRLWLRIVASMMAVVVFCTTYALILPAITMERKTYCGLEEHTHTDECYTVKSVAKKTLICNSEDAAEFVIHTHNDFCFDDDSNLICELSELEEHVHTEDCYSGSELVCDKVEGEGHTHSEECYERTQGDLTCSEESDEHEHTDECYEWNESLICGQDESEPHTHTEECFNGKTELICDLPEVTPHKHDDSCYENGVISCGKPEVIEHEHTAECIQQADTAQEERVAICGMAEHTHTDECYEKPADGDSESDTSTSGEALKATDTISGKPTALTFAYSDEEMSGVITLDWSEKLPDNLECTVVKLGNADKDYAAMCSSLDTAVNSDEQIITHLQLYRLEWTSDGKRYTLPPEITPKVKLTMTGDDENTDERLAAAVISDKSEGDVFKKISGLDDTLSVSLKLYAADEPVDEVTSDTAVVPMPVSDENEEVSYEADTVFADESNNSVSIELTSLSAFALLKTTDAQEVVGDYYKRVDSVDELELTSADKYLIVFANGVAGLCYGDSDSDSDDTFSAEKLEIQPIEYKENSTYFTFVDVDKESAINPNTSPELNWYIFEQDDGTYMIFNCKTKGVNYSPKDADAENGIKWTFTRRDNENAWLLSTENGGTQYASYNYDTDAVGYSTTVSKGTVNMLIFKYIGGSKELIDDISESNALEDGKIPTMTKTDYAAYQPVSGADSETAVLGELHTLAGATVDCTSDASTSQIESKLGMAKSSLTEQQQFDEQKKNDGRLITDKSVIYGKDDYSAIGANNYDTGDFSVTLSALGQEWATDEGNDESVPIDVVFIYDLSDSMKKSATSTSTKTRWMASADAINTAMYEIMDINPQNRVGVVEFSNDSGELIELGRYTADNNEYFTYDATDKKAYNTLKVADSLEYEASAEVSPDAGKYLYQAITGSYAQTYTQRGLQEAYEMFARNNDTTITIDGIKEPVKRQPVIILVTDGDPTLCTYNYMDPKSGPDYGRGYTYGIDGYYTILSSNYFKNLVGIHYGKRAAFYTIGMGIFPEGYGNYEQPSIGYDDSYRRAVLNPTQENIDALDSYSNYGKSTASQGLLENYWKDSSVELKRLLTETCMDSTDTVYIKNGEFVENLNNTYAYRRVSGAYRYVKTEYTGSVTGLGYTSANIRGVDNPYKDDYDYVDGAYFGNLETEDLNTIFEEILDSVQVNANYDFLLKDNSSVVVTDPIGEGMTVKGTPVLRYYGVNYTEPKELSSEDESSRYITYCWEETATRQSSDAKEDEPTVDLSKITLTIATDKADGTQTVTLNIPGEAVPTFYPDRHGKFYYEELPLRVIYRVGLSSDEEKKLLEQAGSRSIRDKVYYTNRFSGDTAGTTVTFEPIDDNPYYTTTESEVLAKTENLTSTAANYFTENVNADGSVTQRLGNNGKLVLNRLATLNITAEKEWEGTIGDKAEVELYRAGTRLDSSKPDSKAEEFVELVDTRTLTEADDWKYSWIGLPKDQTIGTMEYTYTNYYIREVPQDGYCATYRDKDNNQMEPVQITIKNDTDETELDAVEANTGMVVIVNNDSYALPESGGIGANKFIMGGLSIMLIAGFMCIQIKRRSLS